MARASVIGTEPVVCLAVLKQDPGMQADLQELHKFREKVAIARAEALRLGHTKLAERLAQSMVGIERTIAELEEDYARTGPQVVKRLIGAT